MRLPAPSLEGTGAVGIAKRRCGWRPMHARLASYRGGQEPKHIRLLDGGLTDNIGITGFAMERAAADYAARAAVAGRGREARQAALHRRRCGPGRGRRPGAPRHTGLGSPNFWPRFPIPRSLLPPGRVSNALELGVAQWRNDIVS